MMIICTVALVLISCNIIFGLIYLNTGFGKWFYHDILEWHMPDPIRCTHTAPTVYGRGYNC